MIENAHSYTFQPIVWFLINHTVDSHCILNVYTIIIHISLGLYAYCCPCFVIGEMAESLGEDKWMCCLINVLATYAFGHWGFAGHNTYLREKMRTQKGYEVNHSL